MKNRLRSMYHAGIVAAIVGSGCYATTNDAVVTAPSSIGTLVGTTWVAVEVDGMTVNVTRPPDLTFESDQRIGGTSGCNRYTAELNPSFRVGAVATTRMACEPPLMEQESRFIGALEFTQSHKVDGDTLQFKDRTGRIVLRFRRTRAQ